jgi:hypothetical protein
MKKFLGEMALVVAFSLLLASSMFLLLGSDQAALVVLVGIGLVERYWPLLIVGAIVLIIIEFVLAWWRSRG